MIFRMEKCSRCKKKECPIWDKCHGKNMNEDDKIMQDIIENDGYCKLKGSYALDAQSVVNDLCKFLLGENYYTMGIDNLSANAEILYDIKRLYKNSAVRKRLTKSERKRKQ